VSEGSSIQGGQVRVQAPRDTSSTVGLGSRREFVWSGQWHGRLLLSIMLIAAAMPVRLGNGLPVVNSVSVLDLVLVVAAATLFFDLSYRPLDLGYGQVFALLAIPLFASFISIIWSHSPTLTGRYVLDTIEGLVAYLFVVRELSALSTDRIVRYIERFSYLLIIPAVLLLFKVPGFEPRLDDVSHTSGSYLTFFTRLSHPVLGGSNNLAGVLAFYAPILIYWGHVRSDRRITVAGYVTVTAIFLTLSRGTLLAFVIGGIVYALVMIGRRPARRANVTSKIAVIGVVGAAAIGGFYALNPETHALFKDRFTLANVSSRWELITLARTEIADHPVLGFGAGVSTDDVPSLQEGVHNTLLQQIIYFGIPLGVFVFVALCGLAAFFFARARSTPIAGVLAFVITVQLVSYLFESSFEGTVLRVLFYVSIGFAVGLLRSAESPRSDSPAVGVP
jgi:hypothetical protein